MHDKGIDGIRQIEKRTLALFERPRLDFAAREIRLETCGRGARCAQSLRGERVFRGKQREIGGTPANRDGESSGTPA
nr:hypothetical protein [Rhodomicrobium lacus]